MSRMDELMADKVSLMDALETEKTYSLESTIRVLKTTLREIREMANNALNKDLSTVELLQILQEIKSVTK